MSNCEVINTNAKTIWSYEDAFEFSGHGMYNYLVLTTCSIISMAVACDMFGYAITLAAASCDLNLTISQIGLLGGSPFVGLLFAYLWGYYADTKGRRQALLLSTAVGFIFGMLGSFSVNWQMMLVLKIIGCSFSTASYTLTMTYLGESTRDRNRGQYMFIMMSMNLGTEMVTFGLAYIILPLTFAYSVPWLSITFNSWRLYSIMLCTPLGIGALLMVFLQESPKFLADNGKENEALKVLKIISVTNGRKDEEFPVESLQSTITNKEISCCLSLGQQIGQLFQPPLLWTTLKLFYLISLSCCINNAFVIWFPTMLDIVFKVLSSDTADVVGFCESITEESVSHGNPNELCTGTLSEKTIYSGIIASLFFVIVNLSVAKLAAQRRLILMCTLLIAGISCTVIIVSKQPIVSIVFFILAQITGVGLGSIASYFVDLYPTSCRGLAPSLAFMLGRTVSLASVILIGATIINNCNAIFYTFAASAFSGVCVTLLLPQ